MTDRKGNESKSGWNNWAQKKNDWNMGNVKRPKLDIHKNQLSQSSISKSTGPSSASGRGGFRRTSSMPSTSKSSPQKDAFDGFDPIQEEFDIEEAKAAVEAAVAAEALELQSQVEQSAQPSTSKNLPVPKVEYKNNGSSGFENLFIDEGEIAEEDIEDCMLKASQEIQASQNQNGVCNTSFSQAYNVFSKGIDAHSSVLETTFKKPVIPFMKTSQQPLSHKGSTINPPVQTGNAVTPLRNPNSNNNYNKPTTSNPQAEVEVRRLAKLNEESAQTIKSLKDNLRTKEGEASILRSQLKKALIDGEQHRSRSAYSAAASEQQLKDKLSEQDKQLEALTIELQFQKAEAQAAKERYKVLATSCERLRLVEPRSPGPSTAATLKTPTRQRHVSGFLNRSTFEEPLSPRRPPAKRQRLADEEENVNMDCQPITEPTVAVMKPETRSVGDQTDFANFGYLDNTELISSQRITPRTLGQKLSDALLGIQLASVELSNVDLWKNDDAGFDEKETIPTLSLLKIGRKSKQRCIPLDENNRPHLSNCSKSLKHLLSWHDPTSDCPPTRASICQIAEECTGILHYNLLLLQDNCQSSDKDLRDREQDIISRGMDVMPMKKFDLLDERLWYKEEYGVEMRRCLGILSEIALASNFAASLMMGALESNEMSIKKHKFTKIPEYAFLNDSHGDVGRYYLLRVLCDLCSTIVNQKLTVEFNGVLAGIMILLKNCAQHDILEDCSENYILDVVRHVLVARPSGTVLLILVDLLNSVSKCQTIMKGLCSKCDSDDDVLLNSSGICSFTKSSCPLQVLCIQLRAVNEASRWRHINSLSRWLVSVISQESSTPSWILSHPGSSFESHTTCCIMLTTTLILLLSDALHMLQEVIEKEALPAHLYPDAHETQEVDFKPTLKVVMRRSIILLLKLVENNMFKFMARVEGLYEILVQGIDQMREHLDLSSHLERCMEDLLKTEQDTANSTDQANMDDKYARMYLDAAMDLLKL